jgi:hypothetical protein
MVLCRRGLARCPADRRAMRRPHGVTELPLGHAERPLSVDQDELNASLDVFWHSPGETGTPPGEGQAIPPSSGTFAAVKGTSVPEAGATRLDPPRRYPQRRAALRQHGICLRVHGALQRGRSARVADNGARRAASGTSNLPQAALLAEQGAALGVESLMTPNAVCLAAVRRCLADRAMGLVRLEQDFAPRAVAVHRTSKAPCVVGLCARLAAHGMWLNDTGANQIPL